MIRRNSFWLVLVLTSCAGYHPARFTDAPVVLNAQDEQPIAMPSPRISSKALYTTEAYAVVGAGGGLEVARPSLARDVNRLDEVVSSSWFRAEPVVDPLDGYERDGPPKPPFTIVEEATSASAAASSVVDDARGLRYQIVPDLPGVAETRTATMAITSRLFYALGYFTTETYVVDMPDGERVAAVRFPPGTDLGPTPILWTRSDDANDLLPHVDRRSLRATRVLAAWLALPSFPEDMFRDSFIGPTGRGFVRHIVVGFDGALGTEALVDTREDAFDPDADATPSWLLLLTFGMYPKPDRLPATSTGRTGVGLFPLDVSLEHFGLTPPFAPHRSMRPDDAYWMAKRMSGLSERTLARAIAAGRLSSAKSRRYLLEALLSRRRALAEEIFAMVTPCEVTAVRGLAGGTTRIELTDLQTRVSRLPDPQFYRVVFTDVEGDSIAPAQSIRAVGDRLTVSLPPDLFADRKVVVTRLFKQSGGGPRERSVDVHIVKDEGSGRLLGVEH